VSRWISFLLHSWLAPPGKKGSQFYVFDDRQQSISLRWISFLTAEDALRSMETILVVDDNPVVRDLLIRTIGSKGYSVLEAASGTEAVRLARCFHESIALAIIDQTLGDAKGTDLAAEIARIVHGVRVLVISGSLKEDVITTLLQSNSALDFLQKRFTPTLLCERIRQMLDQYDPNPPAA
jgi:two-component system cell cycle sensor histidine kinase/response regulator CckA